MNVKNIQINLYVGEKDVHNINSKFIIEILKNRKKLKDYNILIQDAIKMTRNERLRFIKEKK